MVAETYLGTFSTSFYLRLAEEKNFLVRNAE